MIQHQVSFTQIQLYKSDITDLMNNILNEEWHEKYGIIVTDVTLNVNGTEETKAIIKEIEKTRAMGNVYSQNMQGTMAAATAEAMKNASSNENGAMMGFMGMNMSQAAGANVMNTVMGQENTTTNPGMNVNAAPGTIFGGQAAPSAPVEQAPVETPAPAEAPTEAPAAPSAPETPVENTTPETPAE